MKFFTKNPFYLPALVFVLLIVFNGDKYKEYNGVQLSIYTVAIVLYSEIKKLKK